MIEGLKNLEDQLEALRQNWDVMISFLFIINIRTAKVKTGILTQR